MDRIVNFKLFCLICGKEAKFLTGGCCDACLTMYLLLDPVELY